jgi:hypothetical protein
VLRRFELYSLTRPRPPGSAALEEACRSCGDFVPEVLFSRVGRNRSDAPVDLVWEHAFDSADAYRGYMVHPFHAAVLDRYLLHDSPERVVTDNDLGAGLVGYHCDGPVFDMDGGIRRLVLLRLDRDAPPDAVHRLTDSLGQAPAHIDAMVVSVMAANSLGQAWFDAVTPVGGRPRWTHLWEQGFVSTDAFEAYRHGPSVPAEAERHGWVGHMGGLVRHSVSVHYDLGGAPGPGAATQGVGTQGVQEKVSEIVRGRSKVIE